MQFFTVLVWVDFVQFTIFLLNLFGFKHFCRLISLQDPLTTLKTYFKVV